MSCVGRLLVVLVLLQSWVPDASGCFKKDLDAAGALDMNLLQTSVALGGSVADLSSSVHSGDGKKMDDDNDGGNGFQLVPLAVLSVVVGSVFVSTITALRKGCYSYTFLMTLLSSTAVSAGLGIYFLHVRTPLWELKDISIVNLKIPLLFIDDIYPVNSSACPQEDPCGMDAAKGCASCVSDIDFLLGCYCRRNPNNLPAPPGSIKPADTSNCPAIDKCGLTLAKGCSTCPGEGWLNDGCTCRVIGSTGDFLKRVDSVAGVVRGDESMVSFTVLSDVVSENQNFVGALMLESSLVVSYDGESLGDALVKESMVKARSKKHTPVSVTVDEIDEQMSQRMSQDISANGGLMTVDVIGNITSVVTLFMYKFQVQTLTTCAVTSNVFDDAKVVGKQCTYRHSW